VVQSGTSVQPVSGLPQSGIVVRCASCGDRQAYEVRDGAGNRMPFTDLETLAGLVDGSGSAQLTALLGEQYSPPAPAACEKCGATTIDADIVTPRGDDDPTVEG
jgi:hypothetical protein